MIQKIVKNSDIKFCVDDDSKIQDKFIIKFYTIDKAKAITRTADDVITVNEKRYIKLNWSTIKLLDNGMLNYEVNNLDSDADYDDGVYNSTFTRTTYYYLCADSDGLVDAVEEIELRVDQITTDITGLKSNNATITTQTENLQNRMSVVETKSTNNEENITGLQNRMSVVETKSTNNENSINTMSNELTELKGMVGNNNPDYSSLVSRLEKLEANEAVNINHRITMLEKSKDNLDKRIEEATKTKVQLNQNYPKAYSYEKLNRELDNFSRRVSALEGNSTQGNNESISSAAINNDNIANRMAVVETNNDNIANRASALATDNNSIVNRVSALEENIQDIDFLTPDVEESLKDIVLRFPLYTSYQNPIMLWLDSFETRVSALERGTRGNNDSIANRASALEDRASTPEEASALEDRASTPEEASALEVRVSALENGTQNLNNSIQVLQNWIQSFNSRWPNGVSFSDISSHFANIENRIAALESK